MFKFNFNSENAENTAEPEVTVIKNTSADLKPSRQIEISKEKYEEIKENFSNLNFDVFVSNEIEIGFITLIDERRSDLIAGEYEGGFKIWECTQDLIDFFSANDDSEFKDKSVCDLGCSAGIAGIFALSQDAARVDFQDYNEDVLETFTIPNVILFCEENEREESFKNCNFYSGDWDNFRELSDQKYDIILTSETIYNPDHYQKLLEFFSSRLKDEGKVYVAAKSHYFGVSGNTHDFLKFLDKNGNFETKVVWKSSEGLQREILLLKKKI